MIRLALSLITLTIFALPATAQDGVFDRISKLESRLTNIEADVSTIKMNTNSMGANIDALNAKVDKLMRQQAAPGASAWAEPAPVASSGWNAGAAAGGQAGMRSRARPLFSRLRGSCGAGG